MIKLEMYKYNEKGILIATFEQIFINQDELDLRKDALKKAGFLNYNVIINNKIVETNCKR